MNQIDHLSYPDNRIPRPVYITKTTPRSAVSKVVLELREILAERVACGGMSGIDPAEAADRVDGGPVRPGVPGVISDAELLREVDALLEETYREYMLTRQPAHLYWAAWGLSRRATKPYSIKDLGVMMDNNSLYARIQEVDVVLFKVLERRGWRIG